MADPKNNFPFQADPYTAALPPPDYQDPYGRALTRMGQGMLQHAMVPGAVFQGVQPQQPGMVSDVDVARQLMLQQQAQQFGPSQALNMLGGGTPFAQRGLGVAGGKPIWADNPDFAALHQQLPADASHYLPPQKPIPSAPKDWTPPDWMADAPTPADYAAFKEQMTPRLPGPQQYVEHLKPFNWRGEVNPQIRMDDPATAVKASEAGFNIFKPLFKGGSREQYPEALKDPTQKSWERGLFLADDPQVAARYGQVLPYLARAEKPHAIDWEHATGGDSYDSHAMHNIVEAGHAKGADLLVIRNIIDMGGKQDQFVVLNPAILRAPTAKFDYDKLKQAMPLAGIAGGGAIVLDQNGDLVRYIKGREREHYDPSEVEGIIAAYQSKPRKSHTSDFRYKGGLTGD